MKELECKFWITIGVLTGTPVWAEIGGAALGWWKSRLRVLKKERLEKAIEAKYELMFLHGCDSFGDDRVKSFQFFQLLQNMKNEELSKL